MNKGEQRYEYKKNHAFCESLSAHLRIHLDTLDTLKAAIIPEVYQWNWAP